MARAAYAERERSVSLRPAPDTMVWLTALLPEVQGVACYAALTQAAGQARADGDPRAGSRGLHTTPDTNQLVGMDSHTGSSRPRWR